MKIDFDEIKLKINEGTYHFIDSGSGRKVFDLGNGFVVKIAKNRRGIAQNKVEYQIASTDDSSIFAKIPDVSEDFYMLIMEKAERINSISEVWRYYNVKSNQELFQLEELKNISRKYDLLFADLRRPINWGMIQGRPVIIDYGFTREIRRKYYSLL